MPVAPSTQPSIKLEFTSPYEGGVKNWSQRYHFSGGPLTMAEFEVLADSMKAQLQICLTPQTQLVEAVGYNPGSDLPLWTKPYSVAGTYPVGSNPYAALEMCALWRFNTTARSVKNHPIYLYKWFHNTCADGTGTPDKLMNGIKGTMDSAAAAFVTGLSDGSGTRQYCGPRGAVAQGHVIETYLRAHEFPR